MGREKSAFVPLEGDLKIFNIAYRLHGLGGFNYKTTSYWTILYEIQLLEARIYKEPK